MQQISEIVRNIKIPDRQIGASVSLSLEPRPAPLSADDFDRLEKALVETFELKPVYEPTRIPIQDDNGVTYRHEHGVVLVGMRAIPKAEPNPKLLAAILRPADRGHVAAHLTRLAAHLRWTKGDAAFGVMVEDLSADLRGKSEWAIKKACEEFRSLCGTWYPDSNSISESVRRWDSIALKMVEPPEKPVTEKKPEKWRKPTEEEKAKVRKILESAGI